MSNYLRRTSIVFSLSALVGVAAVAAAIVLATGAASRDAPDDALIALAVRVDGGSPALSVFAGDLQEHPIELPAGSYYMEAVNADDAAFSLGILEVEDGQKIAFAPFSDTGNGKATDREHAAAVRTIASLLADVELARLSVLESFSGGFQTPLGEASGQPTVADLEVLDGLIAEIAAQEEAVMDAVAVLDGKLTAAHPVSFVHAGAAPPAGLLDHLLDTYFPDLFNRMRKLAEDERIRSIEIADKIAPHEREGIFGGMPANVRGKARNYEEWRQALERGDLDGAAAAIRGYLYGADTEAAWEAGHTPAATAAQQGRQLLEAGVDLALQAYGKVPHVSKMIEVTNKAREWEAYVRKVYDNPGAELEQLARDQFLATVRDQVEADLRELAPNLSDSVLSSLAAQLARNVVAAGPQFVSAQPVASPAPDPGWIDEFIDALSEELIARGEQGIAVAVVTDDLRECLISAVGSGLSQDDSLAHCAEALAVEETPPPTPSSEPTPLPTPTPTECWSQTEARLIPCDSTETPAPAQDGLCFEEAGGGAFALIECES